MPINMIKINISGSYVKRSMVLVLVIGLMIPIGIIILMTYFGFNIALSIGAACSIIILIWSMRALYERGLMQHIQLHPDKIIFKYTAYTQEYLFSSSSDWKLEENNSNWVLTSKIDGSKKSIPVSAFPNLGEEVYIYYYGNQA